MDIPDPIKSSSMPWFTTDWFTPRLNTWKKHVVPQLSSQSNIHWLEIGSYEGRSALWTVTNILKNPGSDIVCVDSFGLPQDHSDYEQIFDNNVKVIESLLKLKGHSSDVLPLLPSGRFHAIYVDGSHDEENVRGDLREAWRLAQTGAFIIIDDYPHLEYPGIRIATDEFLNRLQGKYTLLHKEWQVIVRKLP